MSTVTELAILAKIDGTQYETIWNAVRLLVAQWANQYYTDQGTRLFETDDLIQAGYLALHDAVQTFNPERAGFTTHLRFHVRRRFAEVAGRRGTKRCPELHAVSLNEPISDDEGDGLTRLDTLADPYDAIADVDRRAWLDALSAALDTSLNALPDGGELLRERYYQGKSQAEIARERDVVPETVRQQEQKALRLMRNPKYCNRLKPFVEEITNYHYHVGLRRFRTTGLSAVEEIAIHRENLTSHG